ncbi:oligosaccharide flippase family protein [Flavobacterium lipolyticum]|uniref:Oligosaccharide flippase family protein n=1 Tax=Flavobacterium lipolyticum TaxID=2893754 RepID=A0ABS8LZ28_9FLAO|nr:oligosaccharide flippase family protein [Flavobacterium sp. F-126]MCC9017788.1 oligosaccharide flippase family protein [Flavobacterium sp. F-126]
MVKSKFSETIVANKRHINSSFFLFSINFVNFIYPLLISPIIIKKCGLEGFGLVILFQSIFIFIASITDYGFNINATREITLNERNKEFVNRHFFTIGYTKVILFIVAVLFSLVIYTFLPKANEYSFLYFSSFLILIGRAFNPLWILRALHKMKYFFYFFILFKLISFLIIYFFLNDINNLFLINLTIGLSDFLTCFFSVIVLFSKMKWHFYKPNVLVVKNEITAGFAIFIQVISINANAYLNPMILGLFVNEYALGIYCVVEKIILLVKFCGSFVIQSIFPKACELAAKSLLDYKLLAQKLFLFLLISMIIAGVFLTGFSDLIVSYFLKTNRLPCSKFLIYSAWIPFVVAINMVPYMTFMVFNKQKKVTFIMIFSVLLNVVVNGILSKKFGIYGMATGIYITEMFISISLWIILVFQFPKLNFFKNDK